MSVETRQSCALPRAPSRLPWFVGTGVLLVLLLLGGGFLLARGRPFIARSSELPVLARLERFTAVREDGTSITEHDLEGGVWVASLAFTRCSSPCAEALRRLRSLQALSERRLPRLRLVTFSVDPEFDTAERLMEYGRRAQADFRRWAFVSVAPRELEGVIVPALLPGLGPEAQRDPSAIAHAGGLVLIDRDLRVRGTYEVQAQRTVERLLDDAEALAR